jgi:hypothetical protein
LLASIVTDKLQFQATAGDGYYAVSEIQAFGTATVPEPSTLVIWSVLGGIGLAVNRWRKRKAA